MKSTQQENLNDANASTSSQAGGRSPYLLWLIWVLWLPLMIPSFVSFLQLHPTLPRLIFTMVGVVLFFAIYLWASWHRVQQLVGASISTRRTEVRSWVTIAGLVFLSLALTLMGGKEWLNLFFYTSGFIGGSLTIRRAILVAIVFTLLVAALGWLIGLSWPALVQDVVFIPAIIFIMRSVIWSITTSWELRAAREEIARLAVTNERLRIARDLHDLLGLNLSLIALKSELAGRLVNIAPARAANEIHDVENVARSTLQEVRDAVSSYRQPTLASELHAAQEILTAAGIAYRYEGNEQAVDNLPQTIEAVLSWIVREGVTNVIKHSRAHQCLINIGQDSKQIRIEISDDGNGDSSASSSVGNGLRGLAERISVLGGHFEAGPHKGSGFFLSTSIPLLSKYPHEHSSENQNVKPMENAPTTTQEQVHDLDERSIQL